MRAAVSTAAEPWLVVEQVEDPSPAPGELVLHVEACGICGSDLHMAHSLAEHPGIVFGHEFSGSVVALGSEVTGYREGDRVVGYPLIGCGRCPACLSNSVAKCRRVRLIGAQRRGAYAEYVAVGADQSFLLPDGLTPDQGALVEPLAVAHHALERTPRDPGEPVLVLGAGPVGLAVALWASVLGARDVVVTDPVGHRRELAESIGATALDPTDSDVSAAFADLTGTRPRVVVECIGRPGAIQHAVEVAAADAHLTLVGACTVTDTVLPVIATSKELTLQFVVYYRPRDFAQTLDFLAAGRLDPSRLVTGHVTLDELPGRFAQLMSPNPDCKVLIHP